MTDLAHHPKLKQLARNLHIPDGGDCLRELRDHAIASVERMLKEWSAETIGELRSLVADKLSVKIELISEDQDTERLAEKYGQVMSGFRRLLKAEFIKGDTEGLLIDNPKPGKGGRDYLVIVDARGPRKMRAYFTAWHELAHLLLYPRRQAVLDGFRRAPTPEAKSKDPVESAVDHIAGLLAFWEPLFKPALFNAACGNLSLEAIERACSEVAPGASLQSACLAAVRVWKEPVAFVTAAVSPKSDGTSPSLRVQNIVANDAAREIRCEVRRGPRLIAILQQLSEFYIASGDMDALHNLLKKYESLDTGESGEETRMHGVIAMAMLELLNVVCITVSNDESVHDDFALNL